MAIQYLRRMLSGHISSHELLGAQYHLLA